MRSSPSIVPADRLDRDIYLALEDFGARAGCAWRETDEADTDLETILQKSRVRPVRLSGPNCILQSRRGMVAGCDFRGRRRTGPARSRHRR